MTYSYQCPEINEESGEQCKGEFSFHTWTETERYEGRFGGTQKFYFAGLEEQTCKCDIDEYEMRKLESKACEDYASDE